MRTSQVAVLLATLAFAVACGDDDGNVPPLGPAEINITGGETQEGLAGFPATQLLRVEVLNEEGAAAPNVPVVWNVTSGGGTMAADTTRTNAAGEATNSWTLGPNAGEQTATATVAGVGTVTFTATATTGEPLFVVRGAGNNQSGFRLEAVNPVRVDVVGPGGLPVVGTTVTWTVLTGGGSVSPATSTTDANGRATTTWTLGPNAGESQTLRATAGDASIDFTASTVSNPCNASRPFSFLQAGGRELDAADCLLTTGPQTGSFIEYFTVPGTGQRSGTFELTSTALDPFLVILRGATGADTVAYSNDASAGTTNSALRVFLGPGTYRLGATSAVAGQTGAYAGSMSAVGDVANCEEVFIGRGASTTQSVTATDCSIFAPDLYYSDQFKIYLTAGTAVTVSVAAVFDGYITLFDPSGDDVVIDDDLGAGGTETFTYTPAVSGFFTIDVGTFNEEEVGTYTITIGS